jgi:hypothetical protein
MRQINQGIGNFFSRVGGVIAERMKWILFGFVILGIFWSHFSGGGEGRDFVRSEIRDTVVIVGWDGDGDIFPMCSGIWISSDRFLTAAHCIDRDGVVPIFYFNYGERMVFSRVGFVIRFDMERDLALIGSIYSGDHGMVMMGGGVKVGDRVDLVGHPMGLIWSWMPGWVSRILEDCSGILIYQISSWVSHGNSGGGLFNNRGELVGICHSISRDVIGESFFIGAREVSYFLDGDDILPVGKRLE